MLIATPAEIDSIVDASGDTSGYITVIDGNGGVTPNTATLLVEGRNDAPQVSAIDAGTTDEDASPVIIDLLSTATDTDGNTSEFSLPYKVITYVFLPSIIK